MPNGVRLSGGGPASAPVNPDSAGAGEGLETDPPQRNQQRLGRIKGTFAGVPVQKRARGII